MRKHRPNPQIKNNNDNNRQTWKEKERDHNMQNTKRNGDTTTEILK